jgi:glycosyltransferase involved in cell wall biosynthesis
MDRDTAMDIAKKGDIVAFHWDEDIDYVSSFPAGRKCYIIQHFIHTDESLFRRDLEFISVSSYIKQHTKEEYGVDSRLVLNSIDHDIFYPKPVPRETGRVFAIDRGGWKGVDDVKKAEKIVRRRHPEASFVYRDNISQLEIADEYRKASIFVSASWYEGFGLPPLEAMACGTAVVTTDSKGVDDFAAHEKNCLKVPPRNPEAIAEAVITLLEDAEKRESLTREGLKTAHLFSWESSIDILAGIFGITEKRTTRQLFLPLDDIGVITTVMDRSKEPYGKQKTAAPGPLAGIKKFKGSTRLLKLLNKIGLKETVVEGDFDYNKVCFVDRKGDKSHLNCKDGKRILYVPGLE